MRSKGNSPSAAQKRWREQVRELGSVISGGPAIIHHCVGATGMHNKVAIGHWFILPLTPWEHWALHENPNRRTREKQLWGMVMSRWMARHGAALPFGDDVDNAILEWRR